MTFLTDLPQAVASAGLPVTIDPGWETRTRRSGPFAAGAPRSIMVHHTATAAKAAGDYPTLRVIRQGHGTLSGPLSQLGLGRSARVYIVAAGAANHAGPTAKSTQSNSNSIGIEAEHSGTGPWPAQQYDGYVRLVAALCIWYKLPATAVYGHKEAAIPPDRKTDPNFNMNTFRKDVAARIVAQSRPPTIGVATTTGVAGTPTNPGPVRGIYTMGNSRFTVDGVLDAATVLAIQKILGAPQTRVFDTDTIKAMQAWLGVTADGIVGPATRTALYAEIGHHGDPKVGWSYLWTDRPTDVTAAIEGYANERRARASIPQPWPFPSAHAIGANPNRRVTWHDGHGTDTAGRAAIREWQTQAALRGWRITPDGYWGAQSAGIVPAFQKIHGITTEPGRIGPVTWERIWSAPLKLG